MNIFKEFLIKIKNIIEENNKVLNLEKLNSLKGVTVENPPSEFNFDLSCNVVLILSKLNKKNPKELASKIKKLFLEKIKEFEDIEIAGPGFLNIKLKNEVIKKIALDITKSKK